MKKLLPVALLAGIAIWYFFFRKKPDSTLSGVPGGTTPVASSAGGATGGSSIRKETKPPVTNTVPWGQFASAAAGIIKPIGELIRNSDQTGPVRPFKADQLDYNYVDHSYDSEYSTDSPTLAPNTGGTFLSPDPSTYVAPPTFNFSGNGLDFGGSGFGDSGFGQGNFNFGGDFAGGDFGGGDALGGGFSPSEIAFGIFG